MIRKIFPSPRTKSTYTNELTVIAHRGASSYFPENTLSAIRGAIDMSSDMVEVDAMLSKDYIPVIFHDEYLDRCTNGTGKLRDRTLFELKQLDAGSWFDERFKGEKIPTLKEVLSVCKNKIDVNIEIKMSHEPLSSVNIAVDEILRLVEKFRMKRQVLISSFDVRIFDRMEEKKYRSFRALLNTGNRKSYVEIINFIKEYKIDAFHCALSEINSLEIGRLINDKVNVNVYTVDAREDMEALRKMGVKGIFTNKPDIKNPAIIKKRPLKIKPENIE